jgi:hypothetical protein
MAAQVSHTEVTKNLSGQWVSSNGDGWSIAQSGSDLTASQSGRGSYKGTIYNNNTIRVYFDDDVQAGCCSATISGNATMLHWSNQTTWQKQ